MNALATLSQIEVLRLMSKPELLHRFAGTMSRLFHGAVQRISKEYAGDASRIWSDRPSGAQVVYRFLESDGVGPKIATVLIPGSTASRRTLRTRYIDGDAGSQIHRPASKKP